MYMIGDIEMRYSTYLVLVLASNKPFKWKTESKNCRQTNAKVSLYPEIFYSEG